MDLLKFFKRKTKKQIIVEKFYSDYPEVPYISDERESDWIERAEMFPKQSIIPKEIMQRFPDGLLPGHVYMLYWLKKYTNKKVPVYFEYKYGIDFEKEKRFLIENGFLNADSKPTAKGEEAIERHYEVIESQSQKRPENITEYARNQIIEQMDSLKRNGFKEYTYICNNDSCEVCKALDGKHFKLSDYKIGVNAPPMHEGCKCSVSAYSDPEEYEKWLDALGKENGS